MRYILLALNLFVVYLGSVMILKAEQNPVILLCGVLIVVFGSIGLAFVVRTL